ncbi:beta-galactosidase [Sphingomonas sp.]|jgi:beta-galactosidase|uniref:beta-galactosidase n=1 Tax=Sphingomonas sp. TaxID=28214 RepID=UPI002DEA6213|nr:beta-galactosidase [Sphingomonas sp.]
MADEKMRLGVCYYPEHWPEDWWADDARRMAEMGLSRVRIGEFAWSRIEPEPGRFDWHWLDRAVDTLHAAGLGILMGTPTATPPKWLVDRMPDMVPLDAHGRPRGFGSRRHYCFSHQGYRGEAARIAAAMADRYGLHPAIVGWQIDNEYGCHDTVVSYSPAAAQAFRAWLERRYETIQALNAAWGNVFWSMEYRSFAEIEPPNLTVTEPNPAHMLDFRRFSSDQVVAFHQVQAEIVRARSPGRDIIHNFMGFFTEFDHHQLGRALDVASWDSYPLGFLEQFWFSPEEKQAYLRQGHPDIAAFHHDLYRGCSKGRWSVMEQQPGPVNWAPYNPAPLPGMVRLWTLEAMAHGAELVSYFRWRQAPFAQEQMHAGLLRPDRADDQGAVEARHAAVDIDRIGPAGAPPRAVALIFSYDAAWVTDTQPQGRGFSALRLAFETYSALRRRGLDVDIVAPDAPLDGYGIVVIPCLPIFPDALVDRLAEFGGPVLVGPRSGSKTESFNIPPNLPPGPLHTLVPLRVVRVESLRPGCIETGVGVDVGKWLEHVETDLPAEESLNNGRAIVYRSGRIRYVACWPDAALLDRLVGRMAAEAGLLTLDLPAGVRVRRAGRLCFAFNYSHDEVRLPVADGPDFIIGGAALAPADVAVWRS